VTLGGGYVLVFGCAAGDVGIAALFKVSEEAAREQGHGQPAAVSNVAARRT